MEQLKEYTVSYIQDRNNGDYGNFLILTNDGVSYIYKGENSIYKFERPFELGGEKIKATSFNHAFDLMRLNRWYKESLNNSREMHRQLNLFRSTVLRKLGKKLAGKKEQTKINNFLRQ